MQEQGIKFVDKGGRRWTEKAYATMVARTELADAANMANIGVAQQIGAPGVRVRDGGPGDVDEPCRIANGQAWQLIYANLHRYEHPNCRRAFAPLASTFNGKFDRTDPPRRTLLDRLLAPFRKGYGEPVVEEQEVEQVELQPVEEPVAAFTPEELELFRSVTGQEMVSDPTAAREMLANGNFENTTDDELIALDDKLVEAEESRGADVFADNGLDRDLFLGRHESLFEASRGFSHKEYLDGLSDEERSALVYYKRGGYGPINNRLRRTGGDLDALEQIPQGPGEPDTRAEIEAMDRAMENAPRTTEAVALFRRGLPTEVQKAFEERNETGLLGQVFGDDGFSSTTINKDWKSQAVGGAGKAFLMLPEGSRSLFTDGITQLKGAPEYEVLLPRGVRYRITSVARDERDQPIIEAEIIDGE